MPVKQAHYDHIAYFTTHYLDLIIKKEKTLESRFTKTKRAPYKKVETGEKIALKEVGGKIMGHFTAGQVSNIEQPNMAVLKSKYNSVIRGEDSYWDFKKDSKYGTLIQILDLQLYEEQIEFNDSRAQSAWIVMRGKE